MQKKFHALIALMLLLSLGWAVAEEVNVEVSGDRTAVVSVKDTQSPDPDVSGSIKGSVDLKAGKAAVVGDLLAKSTDQQMKDAKAGFFAQMTGKTIEAIGFVDTMLPPDPKSPKTLDVEAKTLTEGDQSGANFSIKLGMANDPTVPSGSGSAKITGDIKAFQSSGKFDLSGGEIKGEDIPFKTFRLDITEVENKTTISLEIKVAKTSEMAPQLDQIPQMAPVVEQQLKKANIAYEGLEFPAPTEEGDDKTGKAKLTLVDIRGTIRPFLGFASGQLQAEMGPDVDVKGAFENMLETRFDKFGLGLKVDGNKLDGDFDLNLSNMDKFYQGYLVILPAVQKQQNQALVREAGEFGPLLAEFLELNSAQTAAALRTAVDANLKIDGKLEFKLEPKEQDLNFTASGELMSSNYQAYVTKAKEAKLPVAEKVVGKLDLEMKEANHLVGDLYFYTDGDMITYYKGMLSQAAASSNSSPEVVNALNSLELKELVTKISLEGNKITIRGKGDTSDLTQVSKLVLGKVAPQFDATFTGMNFDVNMPETGEGPTDVKFFFSDFLPGKNEAQIKEAMGLPASAKVSMDASADATKLVTVDQPEVVVDGQLLAVQEEGQKLLASSPSDVGGSGGGKMGLIALGALLLVGVGGFLMFGKKSS